jgi:hypothetical protein
MTATRRNIWIQDEDWERANQAARVQSVEEQRTITASEWIREAIQQRLEKEAK